MTNMLVVVHVITGLGDGGAEAALSRLCLSDTEDKHIVVSLMGFGKYGPILQKAGVKVLPLHMRPGRLTISGLRQLWMIVREERPDVVQTWMYHADLIGGVIAHLAGIRDVVWNIRHAELDPQASSRSTIWVARLCALLSRWVPRRIIACAQHAAVVHGALGYDSDRMVVIGNGYDLTRFRPNMEARAHQRMLLGISPEARLIGCVARFAPEKDHANLIGALALLKSRNVAYQCLLIGTGMTIDNDSLVKLISAFGLEEEVLLLGPQGNVADWMTAIDVHVLSSISEGFPNVLAEAMACGTPCISTDVGDASLIVGDTGWIVPSQDVTALADALEVATRSVTSDGGWSERQEAARAHVEQKFSLSAMVAAYQAVWSGLKVPPERG